MTVREFFDIINEDILFTENINIVIPIDSIKDNFMDCIITDKVMIASGDIRNLYFYFEKCGFTAELDSNDEIIFYDDKDGRTALKSMNGKCYMVY